MLSGTIKLHPETTKYSNYYNYPTKEHRDAITAETLQTALKQGVELGLYLGARVKHKVSRTLFGRISRIEQTVEDAYNWTSGELEPYEVIWDNSRSNHNMQYSMQEIERE